MSDTKICGWCMSSIPVDAASCPFCGYNGSQRNPVGSLQLGTLLGGRYNIGRYLKVDGEGITYLAYDREEKRSVRIKEYMPATLCQPRQEGDGVLPKPGCEVLFKTTMLDFAEVYKNAARYQAKPMFMGVYGLLQENGTVYAVREYSHGVTLAQYLEELGAPMDLNSALELLAPVFEAVKTLHSDNAIHRGISPETILIAPDGQVKLSGYATQAMRTSGSELMATTYRGYSAPEQYNPAEYQGAFTDIYALGAVLYTCVTGQVPPKANERVDPADLPPAYKWNAGQISHRQSEVIEKALSMDPAQRQKSAQELLDQLNGAYKPEKRRPALKDLNAIQKQILIGVGVSLLVVLLLWLAIRNLVPHGPATSDSSFASSDTTSSESSTSTDALPSAVDNFIGQLYTDIQNNTTYQNQYLFVTETVFSETHKAGYVVSQDPSPGSAYVPGQVITLTVSKGPETVELPNVVGHTLENALAQLNALHISYEVTEVVGDGSVPVGSVSGMDKAAGIPIKVATEKVILYVVREIQSSSSDNSSSSSSSQEPVPPPDSSTEEGNNGTSNAAING